MTDHRGFTVVEVLVALVLTGLCVLAAAAIFGAVIDTTGSLEASTRTWERRAKARVWLQEFALGLRVDAGDPFVGEATGFTAAGYTWSSRGWMSPVRMTVGVVEGRLMAGATGGDAGLDLADETHLLAADYLPDPGARSEWRSEWSSESAAPSLIRLRITWGPEGDLRTDTIFLIPGGGT